MRTKLTWLRRSRIEALVRRVRLHNRRAEQLERRVAAMLMTEGDDPIHVLNLIHGATQTAPQGRWSVARLLRELGVKVSR